MTKPSMDLKGAMRFVKKSEHRLAPLYEALINSLESITQREFDEKEKAEITIRFYFTGLEKDLKKFDKIEIIDTGIGFTKENYERFTNFFDNSKGFNNRGTGRMQFLHRFKNIKIDSIYFQDNEKRSRSFICNVDNFIYDETDDKDTSHSNYETKITMSNYSGIKKENEFFDNLQIEEIANNIQRRFLLEFYLSSQKANIKSPHINIEFFLGDKKTETSTISPENIEQPKTGKTKISYMRNASKDGFQWEEISDKCEVIHWAHFKVSDKVLNKNGVHLCSKNFPVVKLKYEIGVNQSVDGFRYLTAFYGEFLDRAQNVNHAVDGFTFPRIKDIEKSPGDMFGTGEYLFMDEIENKIADTLPTIYKDFLKTKDKKIEDAESIAKAHGIPVELVKTAKINLSDDEKTITKKLYQKQSDESAEKGYRAKKLYEDINELDTTTPDYEKELQEKVNELSLLIDVQNKEELSRYVIRRAMVIELLQRMLHKDTVTYTQAKTKEIKREKLFHDLILKRNSKTEDQNNNNLWVLNEDYLYFDGCSNMQLSKIADSKGNKLLRDDIPQEQLEELDNRRRQAPDVFLFVDERKCIIIEFKDPSVNVGDHLNQVRRYCAHIAKYGIIKFDKFYCYIIGENFEDEDIPDEFNETVDGDFIYPDAPIKDRKGGKKIATAQVEALKYSSIHERAARKNKMFAEKLGLLDILEESDNLTKLADLEKLAS